MASTKVKLNSRGMKDLLTGSVAEKACRPEAEEALAKAQASAPVGETGDYKASLHIEEVTHPTRKVWQVVADVPYAMLVESDTGNLARSL